ncbi:hypothetical protein B1A99_31705 [Cohnella sp. CIP 111063]|nr:hypothetical protein B1A99_31705 [Cohnella sp. CIP 111063]PRX60174.1 S-layer family protein [Cohnella sp. SGD-V74]
MKWGNVMRKSLTTALIALLALLPLIGAWPGNVLAASCTFSAETDGSPGNPYIIHSAEELDCVREDLTASYKLGADIDLSAYGNWVPIGAASIPFSGTFDGEGYIINGLTIVSNAGYIGFFGQVMGSAASIENVRLENVDIRSTNIHANVGGLVGLLSNGTINRCSVTGEIKGYGFAAGGLLGQMSQATLSNSDAHVRLDIDDNTYLGGLVGGVGVFSTIDQSYATGHVSVSAANYRPSGGLVGDLSSGSIRNSYATGHVENLGVTNAPIGGLAGTVSGPAHIPALIENSYALGRVSSSTGPAGGLVGQIDSLSPFYTMTNSYWNESDNPPDLQTVGGESGRDEAVSSDDMKQIATFDTSWWDAPAGSTPIWGVQEGTSYPYLTAFAPSVRVNPLSPAYSQESGHNELTLTGLIRDGSIGEPLEVGYVIRNAEGDTVTSAVYATYASGQNQPFHFSIMLNEADYPEGTYTLTVTGKDTVDEHLHQPEIPFTFVVDSTAPEISLNGEELIELQLGDTFTDPGVTAEDSRDGDVTDGVISSGTIDTSQTGTYILTYQVTDTVGNTAIKTRTVKVYNSLSPSLLLNGLYTMEVEVGDTFVDPGATSNDERDGDLTDEIVITGSVDTGHVGTYSINYLVSNTFGRSSSTHRTVNVVDTTPPVLTLRGANPMRIEVGSTFTDPGATAIDIGDGDLTADITVSGAVYTSQVGTYTLTYKVEDHSGNAAADAVRTVNVVRASSSGGGGGQTGGNSPDENLSGEKPSEENNGGSTAPPAQGPGCLFTDIEKHWAKPGICEAAMLGIVEGVNASTFLPNAHVTRTEFAVMLLRALRIEIDSEAGALPFSDRDSTPKWALQAIRTAVAKGILTGYPDGTLRPMQTVNRSEMAAMVSRVMKWQTGQEGNAYFSDEASIPAWAKGYVEAARERGVLTGRDGNRFAPAEVATRAEAAVVLLRLRQSMD